MVWGWGGGWVWVWVGVVMVGVERGWHLRQWQPPPFCLARSVEHMLPPALPTLPFHSAHPSPPGPGTPAAPSPHQHSPPEQALPKRATRTHPQAPPQQAPSSPPASQFPAAGPPSRRPTASQWTSKVHLGYHHFRIFRFEKGELFIYNKLSKGWTGAKFRTILKTLKRECLCFLKKQIANLAALCFTRSL